METPASPGQVAMAHAGAGGAGNTTVSSAGGLAGSPSVEQLNGCIRDLVGLLTLPAMWNGSDPAAILRLLCETLESAFALEMTYACARIDPAEPSVCMLRIHGAYVSADDPSWRGLVEASAQPHSGPPKIVDDSPIGELRMITYDMGYFGEGSVCVASSDPAFPSHTQSLVLRAAVTLAASALQAARLLREKEQATHARDEFLAVLGHELRNPIAPIVTAINLIRMRSGNPLTREHEIIERQVAQLSGLVNGLLDASRLARGKIALDREPVELGAILTQALQSVNPLFEERRHYLRVEVPATGLLVEGDSARLAQVAVNLLTNAARYTEPGGKISVTAWRENARVKLSVKDNGAGIAATVLPRIFDSFVYGGTQTERRPGSLGIGLSIVRKLVELHGGSVTAASEGTGHGSEFVVTLPAAVRADAQPQATPTAAGIAQAARTERIVLVDDNRDAAELVGALLAAAGHEVSVANDALQALSLIARVKPTVMVLDIGLPVMDGYELARRIRDEFGADSPKLIAVTGYGQDEDRQRSRDVGIEVHLVKPVDVDKLLAAVSAATKDGG